LNTLQKNISAIHFGHDLALLRAATPLIQNITNYVVMNNTANALLAIGASPAMVHAREELAEFAAISSALVVNIGTLSSPWVLSMQKAVGHFGAQQKPIVLDPVGAGATTFRTTTAIDLLETGYITILRGNAAEIMAIAGQIGANRGVDSLNSSSEAEFAAKALASKYNITVCVSGEVDLIVNQGSQYHVVGGDPIMTKVTGMGCTASALCAAFAAIQSDYARSAAHAMASMALAAEQAAKLASGPGSFQMHFLDALYTLSDDQIKSKYASQ